MEAQQCISCSEYPSVYVPSESDDTKLHEVILNPEYPEDSMCDCESFKYRGTCKHQHLAFDLLCLWSEDLPDGKEQTQDEADNMRCPECGSHTEWMD